MTITAFWAETGLFSSAFLSATLLPGNSEIALLAYLSLGYGSPLQAILIASIGNTLGGATTYFLGGIFPKEVRHKYIAQLQKHGPPLMLLSWVPIIGDALCLAAGLLKLPPAPTIGWMALGKILRYTAIALPFQFR
ncbi:YqaA family protein [Parachitinimonas caeni]|uniref:VTT domain-containing protein n=1 Tax=Parachitinimonas caeni TaxID=3031301 RepID=A0ABT7DXH6_9NEIS|nr:VTT domain-containing protein [Parachitinimonas caeni]MDK2124777.1 VTT domain-containing protein [Parachitinimonas caeni]